MSIPTTIPQAILDTILNRLALLFLAAADSPATAREAARQMLATYNPATPDELTLAAEVISLGLHTLEALSYAAGSDLVLNKILRLRGSAVSLSREQHKAQRKLDQLQRTRQTGAQPPAHALKTKAALDNPGIEKAIAAVAAERSPPPARPSAKIPSLQSFHKLEAARIITDNLKRKQVEYASQTAHREAAAAGACMP